MILVVGAGLAAMVAFFIGETLVGGLLLAGIIVHGLGWLYLYRQQAIRSGEPDSMRDPIGERTRQRPGSLP